MTRYEVGGPERFAHQKRGLAKMIATGGVTALLFDPGLGKTATVIDYAGLLALKSPSGEARVLVIGPLAVIDTWVIEAEKFTSPQVDYWAEALGGTILEKAEALAARGGQPFRMTPAPRKRGQKPHHPRALHHEKSLAWTALGRERSTVISASEGPDGLRCPRIIIEVINVDAFASRAQFTKSVTVADRMLNAVKRFNPDLVVVDEAHRIKGARANASRLLARVGKVVKRRVILTGTVMPHSPMDVFGQWRFLDPFAFEWRDDDGVLREPTIGWFKARFAVLGGFMGTTIKGYRNLDELQRVMAKNAIVARKKDALDLPPTTDVEIPVLLSATEKQAYQDMKDALAVQLVNGQMATATNRLAQMMRLRQITSGHLPDDSGTVNVIGDSKVRTIASLVNDVLGTERRVVVFCFFVSEMQALVKALDIEGTQVLAVGGGTVGEDRLAIRKRFGSDDPTRLVLVAQIRTMSLGVNELVTASHAVFGSMSQQRDDFVQARDRLDRVGQTLPVTFHYVIAKGTVDEVILQSHRDRTDLESAMLRHIQDGQ